MPIVSTSGTVVDPSQPTVHIFHGIHVAQPYGGIGKLKFFYHAAGFRNVLVHEYGWVWAFTARFKNPDVVKELLPLIKKGDICVGHSNGCTIIYLLAEAGAPIGGAVLYNPALDRDKALGKQVRWVHVYHNGSDSAVSWSRLLLWHPWGDQGKIGYQGPRDGRYTNFDGGRPPKGLPRVSGHSHIFTKRVISLWGAFSASNAASASGIVPYAPGMSAATPPHPNY